MKSAFTIQAKASEKIVRRAAVHGVTADDLYRAVQLDPSVLLDPDNRIPFAQLVDLYEKAAELTGDAGTRGISASPCRSFPASALIEATFIQNLSS